MSPEIYERLPRTRPELEDVVRGICSMLGAKCEITYASGPPTVCDHTLSTAPKARPKQSRRWTRG